jgi:formyl-CoA transferase
MYEPLLGLLAQRIAVTARDGTEPGRHGNRFPTMAPRNTYRTADGEWVAITAGTDELVRRALAVVGRPELADDPRFRTNLARVAHADELDEVLGAWIGARACAEVVDAFTHAGVSLAAVDGPRRVARNPHFAARGDLTTVGTAGGSITTAAPTPHYAPSPGRIGSLGGALGEANEEIYGGLLGLAADEIAALHRDGVI